MNRIAFARKSSSRGFTLVEILIVVIILGILAAIVIPQFTNASQDARKSSLTSQLQTLRSQISLYALQHSDKYPTGLQTAGQIPAATAWAQMIVKTDQDQTVNTAGLYGPYLQTSPVNGFNTDSTHAGDVLVVAADKTFGTATGGTAAGWVFNNANGKIWATSKSGTVIYDESNPGATTNDN